MSNNSASTVSPQAETLQFTNPFDPTFPPDWFPLPFPRPVPGPLLLANRSAMDNVPVGHGDILEILEACYVRPDIRTGSVSGTQVLTGLLAENEQALKQIFDLIDPQIDLSGEREPITLGALLLWTAGAAAVGAVLAWAAN